MGKRSPLDESSCCVKNLSLCLQRVLAQLNTTCAMLARGCKPINMASHWSLGESCLSCSKLNNCSRQKKLGFRKPANEIGAAGSCSINIRNGHLHFHKNCRIVSLGAHISFFLASGRSNLLFSRSIISLSSREC